MQRIFRTRQEGRTFLENLGVTFNADGSVVFPNEPTSKPAQDLTVAAQRLAFEIVQHEVPLGQVFPHIGAIVTVWRKKKHERRLVQGPRGHFHAQADSPPSLVSQFTAQLGPMIHLNQQCSFGKLVRLFVEYDERSFECYGDTSLLEGLRTLIVVDHEGLAEKDLDVAERTAKLILSPTIQRGHLKLTDEEDQELSSLDEDARPDYIDECITRKRVRLCAGIVSMVSTAEEAVLAAQMESWLGFMPRHYTVCDYAPEPK